MAQDIVWSEESLDDIDGIAEFISRDSAYYAERVVATLFSAGESLSEHPERGRVVPELGDPDVRELFIYSYRLLYRIVREEREIRILAVIHGKRLLESVERFS